MYTKILAITWVDIYRTFTDRVALLMNIAAPLAISLIIGAALGGGSGDISIQQAQVGIINQDSGTLGALYPCLLIEAPPADIDCTAFAAPRAADDTAQETDQPAIGDFIAGQLLTSEVEAALAQVESGDLDALLIIPPDFSQTAFSGQPVDVALHYNPGGGIPVDVARSIINGITTDLNTTLIATQVIPAYARTLDSVTSSQALGLSGRIQAAIQGGTRGAIQLVRVDVQGEAETFQALQYFAPSMAIFFMTFGMAAGAQSILLDRRHWTMQRILTTPIPRWFYLAGKTLGTYTSGVFQMTILIVATSLVSRFIFGSDVAVWGSNVPAIILLTLAVVAAATGLGMIIAALGNNLEQVNAMSTIVLVILAAVGGTFLPVDDVPVVNELAKLTLNHWGLQGFIDLSLEGEGLAAVLPNIGILLLMGAVFTGVAVVLFKRRHDL